MDAAAAWTIMGHARMNGRAGRAGGGTVSTPKRVAVTGSRSLRDWKLGALSIYAIVADEIEVRCGADAILVYGAATGVDAAMSQVWLARGYATHSYQANWKKYGCAAGPIRNGQMVASGLDLLVVFPGGAGTQDMHDKCLAAGVPAVSALELAGFKVW